MWRGKKSKKGDRNHRKGVRSLDQPLQRGISLRKQLAPSLSFGLTRNRAALQDSEGEEEKMEQEMTPPVGISEFEKMERRRRLEFQLVRTFDRTAVNAHRGEYWNLVSAQWMKRWIDFVVKKGPLPGRITQMDLFEAAPPPSLTRGISGQGASLPLPLSRNSSSSSNNGSSIGRLTTTASGQSMLALAHPSAVAGRPDLRLKPGLRPIEDWRAVHPIIWFMFVALYGKDGGPDVCRSVNDLYADDVTAIMRLRMAEEVEAKAQTELKRYAQHYGVSLETPAVAPSAAAGPVSAAA